MTFFIQVIYTAPSRERMFLEKGWGVRDVRGVYLSHRAATLQIPPYLFSRSISSDLSLKFSVSKRSIFDAIYIKILFRGLTYGAYVTRNQEATIKIPDLKSFDCNPFVFQIINGAPHSGGDKDITFGTADLVSLEQLTIMRFQDIKETSL